MESADDTLRIMRLTLDDSGGEVREDPAATDPSPVAALLDAADELHKAGAYVRLIIGATSQPVHDAELTREGALWLLSEIEGLIAGAGEKIDAATDALYDHSHPEEDSDDGEEEERLAA